MNGIIIILPIIAFIVWKISEKASSKYYWTDMQWINIIDRDNTMKILEMFRNITNDFYSWDFDVFETDCRMMVFTNIGLMLAHRDGTWNRIIPYDGIKSFSEPVVVPDEKTKFYRKITIEYDNGSTYEFMYCNKKNNRFAELFDNIQKYGYPIPNYSGAIRGIKWRPKPEYEAEDVLIESDESLYEGH